MKNIRTFMAGALTAAVVSLLAAPAALAGTIEDIQERGRVIIGLSTFVPWAMRAKNGDLIGFEVDVGRKLAEDMGVDVEFVPTAWDGIIPALLSKKFDVIITGMVVKPKRNLTVNFSRPLRVSHRRHGRQQEDGGGFGPANPGRLEQFEGDSHHQARHGAGRNR